MATPVLRNMSGYSDNTNGTFTWTYRVQDGRNRALYAIAVYRASTQTVSMSFNSDAFTEVSTEVGGGTGNNGRRMRVFRLLAPDVGSYTMSVTRTTAATNCHVLLLDLTDVNQSDPDDTVATLTQSGTTTTSTIDVTATVGDLVVDFLVNATTATADDSRPLIPFGSGGTPNGWFGRKVADATTETCAWTYSSTALGTGQIGFAIKGDNTGSAPSIADRSGAKSNRSFATSTNTSAGEVVTTGATVYIPLAAFLESAGALSTVGRTAWTEPGDITWRFRVTANAASSSSTFTVMEDGVATAVTASVGAGVTGWITLGPYTADGTTDLSIRFVNGGGGSITLFSSVMEFEPDDAGTTLTFLSDYAAGSITAGSGYDNYFPINGLRGAASSSGPVPWPTPGDMAELGLYQVAGAARTFDSEYRLRINGANGTNVLNWTGSDTTSKVDSTHTDTLAYLDTLETRFTNTAGTGTFEIERMSAFFRSANGHFVLPSGSRSTGGSVITGDNGTRYMMPGGTVYLVAAEADAQVELLYDCTFCRMVVVTEANNYALSFPSGDASVVFRVNGADTDLKVNILRNAGSGTYYDVLSTVNAVAGDDISIVLRAPVTGTSSMQIRGVFLVGVSAGTGGVGHRIIGGAWGGRVIGA